MAAVPSFMNAIPIPTSNSMSVPTHPHFPSGMPSGIPLPPAFCKSVGEKVICCDDTGCWDVEETVTSIIIGPPEVTDIPLPEHEAGSEEPSFDHGESEEMPSDFEDEEPSFPDSEAGGDEYGEEAPSVPEDVPELPDFELPPFFSTVLGPSIAARAPSTITSLPAIPGHILQTLAPLAPLATITSTVIKTITVEVSCSSTTSTITSLYPSDTTTTTTTTTGPYHTGGSKSSSAGSVLKPRGMALVAALAVAAFPFAVV